MENKNNRFSYALIIDALKLARNEWGSEFEPEIDYIIKCIESGRFGDIPFGFSNGEVLVSQYFINKYFDGDTQATALIGAVIECLPDMWRGLKKREN